MSDNEVIVTIEPELLDFETTHKGPRDVGNSKPSPAAAPPDQPDEDPATTVVYRKRVLP